MPLIEIGPGGVGHPQLGIADLPEKEVADAHLAGGADEEVGIGHPGGVEGPTEAFLVDRVGIEAPRAHFTGQAPGGLDNLAAGTVVDRQAELHAVVAGRQFGGPVEGGERLRGETFTAPDHRQPDTLLHEERPLLDEILLEEAHQEGELGLGAPPVLAREAKERELVDAKANALLGRPADTRHAAAVPLNARQAAALRPAAVAVHDDGDMPRRGIGARRGRGAGGGADRRRHRRQTFAAEGCGCGGHGLGGLPTTLRSRRIVCARSGPTETIDTLRPRSSPIRSR